VQIFPTPHSALLQQAPLTHAPATTAGAALGAETTVGVQGASTALVAVAGLAAGAVLAIAAGRTGDARTPTAQGIGATVGIGDAGSAVVGGADVLPAGGGGTAVARPARAATANLAPAAVRVPGAGAALKAAAHLPTRARRSRTATAAGADAVTADGACSAHAVIDARLAHVLETLQRHGTLGGGAAIARHADRVATLPTQSALGVADTGDHSKGSLLAHLKAAPVRAGHQDLGRLGDLRREGEAGALDARATAALLVGAAVDVVAAGAALAVVARLARGAVGVLAARARDAQPAAAGRTCPALACEGAGLTGVLPTDPAGTVRRGGAVTRETPAAQATLACAALAVHQTDPTAVVGTLATGTLAVRAALARDTDPGAAPGIGAALIIRGARGTGPCNAGPALCAGTVARARAGLVPRWDGGGGAAVIAAGQPAAVRRRATLTGRTADLTFGASHP